MRTTLKIDDDVLFAAKDLARRDHKTMGKVISELARKTLTPETDTVEIRNGVPLFPHSGTGKLVTMEMVNRLRDDSP